MSRLLHPVEVRRPRELRVLDGISFDVFQGEFFGIVGRNGSGKSTLLRTLSSIYRIDSGTVRVAGRVAPLIELGVGFDQELSGRENIVLNGVMLGLSPRELRRRADAVLDFAGVREFRDVALKNYSSGMRIRLAFATLVQAEPEILLVDEILAVGDAEFREKCTETFLRMKAAGKTILLVTHTMDDVKQYCDRAMLLERGRIAELGEPSDAIRRYFELTLQHRRGELAVSGNRAQKQPVSDPPVRARISGLRLKRSELPVQFVLGQGDPIEVEATVEVEREVKLAGLRLEIRTDEEVKVFAPSDTEPLGGVRELGPGQRVLAETEIENRLMPGRYVLGCAVLHEDDDGELVAASPVRTVGFEVKGEAPPGAGLVRLEHTFRVSEIGERSVR